MARMRGEWEKLMRDVDLFHSLLAAILYDNEESQATPLHDRKNGDMNEHNGAVLERRAAHSLSLFTIASHPRKRPL